MLIATSTACGKLKFNMEILANERKSTCAYHQQINKEFYSAYLYLNFSNYFEEVGLDGFANWYKIQAQEERDHAMLFSQYLQNENQKVTLEAIDKPDLNATCHIDVLKAGLEHEKYVTSLINDIYSEAYEAKDFRTMQFLDWFVKEQGEEETNAKNLISKSPILYIYLTH